MSVDRRPALLRHDHGMGSPDPFSISSPANNEFIKYNSTSGKWENFDLFGTANTWTAQQTVKANGGSFIKAQAYDVAHDSAFNGHLVAASDGTARGFFGSIPADGASYITMYTWDDTLGTPAWNRIFGAVPGAGDLELGATNITWEGNVIANLATAQTWTGAQTFSSLIISDPTVSMTDSSQSAFVRGGDTGFTSVCGGSAISSSNGARITMYGQGHATYPGELYLVPGTAGEVFIYNGSIAKVLETTSAGVQVNETLQVNSTTTPFFIVNSGSGYAPQMWLKENGVQKGVLYYDATNHYQVLRKYSDSSSSSVVSQLILYDNGSVGMADSVNGIVFYVGTTYGGGYYKCQSEQQQTFAGRVASTGTAYRLPSGWTSTKVSTGRYRVTHSLGTSAYTVTAEIDGTTSAVRIGNCTRATTYFDVYVYAYNSTTAIDANVEFILRMD